MIQPTLSKESTSASVIPPPWRGPLFVIGLWRSGTSLLYALLNKHPQIGLLFEGDLFLLKPMFWLPEAGSSRLARWELRNGAPTRNGIDVRRIMSNASQLKTTMLASYEEYARQKGATIWGEKSPLYHHSLIGLARDFPDARFMIIWRDPRAILRSVVRASDAPGGFFSQRGMVYRTLIGYKEMKLQCDRLVSLGVPVHQIQYETLVSDPVVTMTAACEFLGIPFVASAASLEGANRSAIGDDSWNSLVKSERIVSSLHRPEVLPKGLSEKIERYISLWREESGGSWPLLATPQTSDHRKPSWRERAVDRCGYAFFRTLDSIKLVLYCSLPLRFLRARYAFRDWRRASAAKHRNQSEARG
ncbi:MAG: sulfotransferase [Terriglobales bacterium]